MTTNFPAHSIIHPIVRNHYIDQFPGFGCKLNRPVEYIDTSYVQLRPNNDIT